MNNKKKTHSENRVKVCGPCGKKIHFGKTSAKKFLITTKIEGFIKKFININYDIQNEKFPLSICRTCYLTMHDADKNIFKRPIQNMPDYASLILPKSTRTTPDECNCYICLTGRYVGHQKPIAPNSRNLNNEINSPKGRYGATNVVRLPKKDKEPKKRTSIQRCIECHQEIGKGINHKCKNPQNNISKIVEKLPGVAKEQVASNVIREMINAEYVASRHIENEQVELSTKGSKMRVVVNPSVQENIKFTEVSLDNFRANVGLSKNKMNKVTNFLRAHAGKNSVPTHYREHMVGQSKLLEDVYHSAKYSFECDGGQQGMRPVVFANAEEIIEAVVRERDFEGTTCVKVMADGGQGFFKISMSIFQESYSAELNRNINDSDDEDEKMSTEN